MSAYTKVNFMDIEGGDGDLQMRFSRKLIDSKELGVTYTRYARDYKNPVAHTHEVQEEVYVVIAGGGRMLLDDKVEELKRWDVVRVAPETVRSFEAGPDGLEMIVVGGQMPEGGDGKTTEADWPS